MEAKNESWSNKKNHNNQKLNQEPLVSVLITVFNREHYLEDAVESVLHSSFQDFEIIIVDDDSNDNSFHVAQNLASRDSRIHVYRNESNLGDYPNRNIAATYAIGKYLKYLDADDVIYKFSLEYMVDALETNPEVGMAISHNVIDDDFPYPHVSDPYSTMYLEYFGNSALGVGPSASIIRKSTFWSCGGFSGKRFLGDQELWLKIGMNYSIVKLQPSLIWYRRHDLQEINIETKFIKVRIERFNLRWINLSECNKVFTSEEFKLAKVALVRFYFLSVLKMIVKQRRLKTAIIMLLHSPFKLKDFKFFFLLFFSLNKKY